MIIQESVITTHGVQNKVVSTHPRRDVSDVTSILPEHIVVLFFDDRKEENVW